MKIDFLVLQRGYSSNECSVNCQETKLTLGLSELSLAKDSFDNAIELGQNLSFLLTGRPLSRGVDLQGDMPSNWRCVWVLMDGHDYKGYSQSVLLSGIIGGLIAVREHRFRVFSGLNADNMNNFELFLTLDNVPRMINIVVPPVVKRAMRVHEADYRSLGN